MTKRVIPDSGDRELYTKCTDVSFIIWQVLFVFWRLT